MTVCAACGYESDLPVFCVSSTSGRPFCNEVAACDDRRRALKTVPGQGDPRRADEGAAVVQPGPDVEAGDERELALPHDDPVVQPLARGERVEVLHDAGPN